MSSSHQEGRHPTFKQYVLVAIILFVITIVEFLLIWPRAGIVESLGYSKIPVLAILSAVKFAIVIAFYMHLKFDNSLLTWVFLAGLFLAFGVGLSLLGLFFALGGEPRAYALEKAIPYAEHGEEQPVAKPTAKPRPTQAQPRPTPTSPGSTTDVSAQTTESSSLDGRTIFTGPFGCGSCHTIEGLSTGTVGPNLTHVATNAATRKPGMPAEEYITESILDPEAFVVEGALPGIMTKAITSNLSDDEVKALVDFLLAQK